MEEHGFDTEAGDGESSFNTEGSGFDTVGGSGEELGTKLFVLLHM